MGFAFLVNLGGMPPSPFTLLPGFVLDRANASERAFIRAHYRTMPVMGGGVSSTTVGKEGLPSMQMMHDLRREVVDATHSTYHNVPEHEARFFVIRYEATFPAFAEPLFAIEEAASLLQPEMRVGFNRFADDQVSLQDYHFFAVARFFTFPISKFGELDVITSDVLERWRALSGILVAREQRDPIRRMIRDRRSLLALPEASPFEALAHFAFIESLITHQPKGNDPYESLGRQVRQKMLLLSKRFNPPLDYERHFGNANPESAWKKLYELRSCIAHGARVSFSGDFQVLRDLPNVVTFVTSASRALVLHSVADPQLVADLKAV